MIETARVKIRPIRLVDKKSVFHYRSDTNTNKYQSWIPQSVEEVEDFIRRNPPSFDEPGTWFQLVIFLKETKEVIGDIGVHFIDDYQCELGCTLSKEYHRKGLAYESLKSLINHLFKMLKKHRIQASMDPENVASIHLFEKLKFRKEAHFIKSFLNKGKWYDDVIYAMLDEDWK